MVMRGVSFNKSCTTTPSTRVLYTESRRSRMNTNAKSVVRVHEHSMLQY